MFFTLFAWLHDSFETEMVRIKRIFANEQTGQHQRRVAAENIVARPQYLARYVIDENRRIVAVYLEINDERQSGGLTRERIEKFEHFTADETLVGEECAVCLGDLKVGMQMVRLGCHINHYFCKTCVSGWFKDNKTCPTCRHTFN